MPLEGTPQRALVITPHPDDCEIGCGGTIVKWIRAGAEVVLVVCTNGDKGSDDPTMTSVRLASIREQEQREAAKVLGLKEVVFLNHPDGELEDSRRFRGDLVREIRRHRPDVVLTTDPFRQSGYMHRDHRMAGQVTLDAVFPFARDHLSFPEHRELGLVPHKTGWVYLWGSEHPDTFVDISETIETKIAALSKHGSQMGVPLRDGGKWIFENAERVGKEHGMQYAEQFRMMEYRR
jgi:LmbE family N-acetylglucosaminyl deacetylase